MAYGDVIVYSPNDSVEKCLVQGQVFKASSNYLQDNPNCFLLTQRI